MVLPYLLGRKYLKFTTLVYDNGPSLSMLIRRIDGPFISCLYDKIIGKYE